LWFFSQNANSSSTRSTSTLFVTPRSDTAGLSIRNTKIETGRARRHGQPSIAPSPIGQTTLLRRKRRTSQISEAERRVAEWNPNPAERQEFAAKVKYGVLVLARLGAALTGQRAIFSYNRNPDVSRKLPFSGRV
jgi:hypothetical protein